MGTNVYFVRHCEPNAENRDDFSRELSAKGLKDCKLVTDYLSDKDIDVIYSSPYKRAVDTIKEFADKSSLEIHVIDDLHERVVGGWVDDFGEFVNLQWKDHTYKLPEGESLEEVQRRNINALNEILKNNKGKNIAIASHGTAISTVINYYQPTFGINDFHEIVKLMPFIALIKFDEDGRFVGLFEHRFTDR